MSFEILWQQIIVARPDSHMPAVRTVEGQPVIDPPHPETINAFVNSLKPSLSPSRCSRFFWGMFACFLPAPSREVIEHLRRSNPEIFTVALEFITTHRTREELVALGSSLLVCDCPIDADYWVHALADSRPTTATEAAEEFFDSLCGIVREGLSVQKRYTGSLSDWPTLDSLVRASEKSLQRTGNAIWPSKHSDVFLGKQEEVVSMIWRIFDTFPATEEPLRLFWVLWKISSSTVSRAATLIDDRCWPAQLISNANRSFDEGDYTTRETTYKFDILVNLLYEVILTFGREEDTGLLLSWCGHDLNVVRFVSRVLSTDASKNLPRAQTGMLAYVGQIFWEFAVATKRNFDEEERKTISPLIKAPPDEIFDKYIDEPPIDELRTLACAQLVNAALSRSCAAPGCRETTTTKDRRFHACSQCRIASYCSKECQVAGWKHFEIPHKPICHTMKAINKKLEVDWMRIGMAARQDALWKRSNRLTLQECRDIMVWIFKATIWESHSIRVPQMDEDALHSFRSQCKDWGRDFLKIDI